MYSELGGGGGGGGSYVIIYITRKMVPIPRRASLYLVVGFIHVNRKEEEEGETKQQQQFTKGCNIFTDYKYTTSP